MAPKDELRRICDRAGQVVELENLHLTVSTREMTEGDRLKQIPVTIDGQCFTFSCFAEVEETVPVSQLVAVIREVTGQFPRFIVHSTYY